jgi:hypothetical protein
MAHESLLEVMSHENDRVSRHLSAHSPYWNCAVLSKTILVNKVYFRNIENKSRKEESAESMLDFEKKKKIKKWKKTK